MCLIKNYLFHTAISNFKTDVKELEFKDFSIVKVRQGKDAAEWRKKLSCKQVPRYILTKEFKNYKIEDDDITYSDKVTYFIHKLLFSFRLFKPGDIIFSDDLTHDQDTNENLISIYTKDSQSDIKYLFKQNEIKDFENFNHKILKSNIFNNDFFRIFINYFMSGVNKGINFNSFFRLGRIIDYFIALESIFLIDDSNYFLGHTISERISKLFLKDNNLDVIEIKKLVKFMYNLRSEIAHGNFISTKENKGKKLNDIKTKTMEFENIFREAIKKILYYNLKSKIELEKFLKQIYEIPYDAKKIMTSANEEASKLL